MRTKESPESRFWKYVEIKKESECWTWLGSKYRNGYGQFFKSPMKITAHRFSYELKHGEITNKTLVVCHTCDNRECVNPNHLFLATQKKNMEDMLSKGRQGVKARNGEINGRSKLTWKQVREIRFLFETKSQTVKELIQTFEISESQIRRIINNETWREV